MQQKVQREECIKIGHDMNSFADSMPWSELMEIKKKSCSHFDCELVKSSPHLGLVFEDVGLNTLITVILIINNNNDDDGDDNDNDNNNNTIVNDAKCCHYYWQY